MFHKGLFFKRKRKKRKPLHQRGGSQKPKGNGINAVGYYCSLTCCGWCRIWCSRFALHRFMPEAFGFCGGPCVLARPAIFAAFFSFF
jgi:hypothetical protein